MVMVTVCYYLQLSFNDFFDERVADSNAFDLQDFIVTIKDTSKLHNFCAMHQMKKKTFVMSMLLFKQMPFFIHC